jgi:hypothetical protein
LFFSFPNFFISRFTSRQEINGTHDLSIILVTMEKIVCNTDEVYLLNHVKLFLEKTEQHQLNEIDYLAKSIKQTIENCLKFINLCPNDYLFGKLFRKYLFCLINLNKFSSVINCWRKNMLLLENNNNQFINLEQFSRNHNMKWFDCLFAFKLDLGIDKGLLLEHYVVPMQNLNDQLRKHRMYERLFHKYVSTWFTIYTVHFRKCPDACKTLKKIIGKRSRLLPING